MFMGIAMFLAQNEENKQERAKEFYDVISKFEVMLATPTLSNARTNRHQLSSCYIGSSPDNIEGIFDGYKEMALLSKFGGGIGWDWNSIRALGGMIDGHKSAAGGTIPFLKITNDIALAVDQLGTRKGAIAVYIEPWHMDIEEFIDLKKNSGEERRRAHDLFPALWINDLFMKRILEDGHWTLFDPYEVKDLASLSGEEFEKRYVEYENDPSITKNQMKAKALWKKVLTSYFESGSPFLCFKDNANNANPNNHTGFIRSSNLCTEIFQNTNPNHYLIKLEMEDGEILTFEEEDEVVVDGNITKKANKITALDSIEGKKIFIVEKEKIDGDTAVCNLASVNLSKINTKEDIHRVVPTAIRMLDNVIDLNFYPLRKVKATNQKTRAIGLGVMGESQMVAEHQLLWGSNEHLKKIDAVMESISYSAIKASSQLAVEKGIYPTFDGSNWSKGIMPMDHAPQAVNALVEKDLFDTGYDWDGLREEVKTNGMRNGYLMAIAPTSSISILVGTTQAIEPVYKRKWFEENMSGQIPVVVPNLSPDTWNYYTPAYEVEQLDIIKAAAVRQKWIDQGQSTNIFMSLDKASGKYLHQIYTLAWQLGLKSTYYLRSQSPEAVSDVADRSQECIGCQ
jgi:ribonucleoside-diphosphate reductase alpha chain